MAQWVPALVAIVSIIGAAITYGYQRRVDRRSTLIENRRQVYAQYLLVVQRNMVGHRDMDAYHSAYQPIFIYGSDDVVRMANAFHKSMANGRAAQDPEGAKAAYARLLAAMRADCFDVSRIDTEEMRKLLPFD